MTSEKWKTFGLLVLAVILPPAVFLIGQRWWSAFFATIITVAIFWPAAALWAIVAVARKTYMRPPKPTKPVKKAHHLCTGGEAP